ncbi:hypothetical protein WA026_000159 [Henosepilachna vigintioctopunctata]|uniref:Uncharacterized protein n=1 Tax=Henosepilachna vigintioctopunctata TaxID=420089 RepID=A0AAW1V6C7_9CUCU
MGLECVIFKNYNPTAAIKLFFLIENLCFHLLLLVIRREDGACGNFMGFLQGGIQIPNMSVQNFNIDVKPNNRHCHQVVLSNVLSPKLQRPSAGGEEEQTTFSVEVWGVDTLLDYRVSGNEVGVGGVFPHTVGDVLEMMASYIKLLTIKSPTRSENEGSLRIPADLWWIVVVILRDG